MSTDTGKERDKASNSLNVNHDSINELKSGLGPSNSALKANTTPTESGKCFSTAVQLNVGNQHPIHSKHQTTASYSKASYNHGLLASKNPRLGGMMQRWIEEPLIEGPRNNIRWDVEIMDDGQKKDGSQDAADLAIQ